MPRYTTALNLSASIGAGECSVSEVTAEALEQAAADQHGAFVHISSERAMARALELDALIDEPGLSPGPLFGVPVPIKDLTMVAGDPCRFGSPVFADQVAEVDDGVVSRLAAAHTVMIGKTSTPEFGLPCYTEPEGAPAAVTPWSPPTADGRPGRMAGGSSGGAAAAVAAGIVPLAHGNDGGGSVRIPAACCGILGMKPSRGFVSPGPHGVDGSGLASHGILARTVSDIATGLAAIRGNVRGDTYFAPGTVAFADALVQPTRRLRIGFLGEPIIAHDAKVHAEALTALQQTMERLAALGHQVGPAPIPFRAEAWDSFRPVWAVSALQAPVDPADEGRLRPLTQWLREQGRQVTGLQYAQAVAAMQQVTRQVGAAWRPFDIVVTPTLAQPPLPVGALRDDADPAADFEAQTRFTPWTSVQNITGSPAISLPLHHADVDGERLPFGIQVIGPTGADALVLQVARDLMGGSTVEAVPPIS